jgi:hypothetical protein
LEGSRKCQIKKEEPFAVSAPDAAQRSAALAEGPRR